ncbi:MAG: transporter [Clostridiales bacterium]|jgi:ATP-binding cassette subfamily B protein|nr:transporter [Clostridiales bacterium]
MPDKSEPKRQNKKYIIVRLGKYLLQYKWLLILALILTGSSNILALVGPRLSGYAIDAIEFGKGKVIFEKVFYYVALMIIFYILSSILSYILSLVMIAISRKVVFKMREDVFDKLVELPVGFFDVNQTGDIISKISYDIDTINTSLSTDLIQICASIITVVGAFVMMLTISPILVLVLVIMIPLSIFCTKYMTKRTRPLFRKRSVKLGELNGFVEEMLSGQKTIRAYNQEETILEKFNVKNEEAVNAYYNAEYYGSIVGPMINFINNLSLTFISVFGAILYLLAKLTLGNISSFVLYSRKFSGPINETANIMSELQSAFAAAERVFKLMDELPEIRDCEDAKELFDVYGDVELKSVKFGYSQDKIIIHNLDLKVESGNLIAIVGPTGAGKTTLINLLMRFYDVNDGNIYVDNNEIIEITRKSLRRAYAMVLQDTWLFSGTIFENIAYGKENATMEEVVAVAKAAKIHSYIKRLPDGYNTILSEDGTNISKGQKQLLTIARAMLLDSKMLILDEATSNVDTRTEIQIQDAMRTLMKDKTCFVIAHRLSTIRNADQILVVKDGNIIEQGNHEQLMKEKGFYSQLYYSQFD